VEIEQPQFLEVEVVRDVVDLLVLLEKFKLLSLHFPNRQGVHPRGGTTLRCGRRAGLAIELVFAEGVLAEKGVFVEVESLGQLHTSNQLLLI
jgi:hypothetical protein